MQYGNSSEMSFGSNSTGNIEYGVTETDDDLRQILELQQANRPHNLSPEELQSQGFVSAQHDLETLRKMHDEYPHVVAKVNNSVNGTLTVVGYALCMMRSAERHITILSGLFSTVDAARYREKSLTDMKYFVMGQVCIDKSFRGGYGIFQGMYSHMRIIMAPHFDCIVTSIASRNPRSLRAHKKVGFQLIHQYSSFGEDWNIVLWDWKDSNRRTMDPSARVIFTVAESEKDLEGILALQADNHVDSLSSAEMETQGFVSIKHDINVLKITGTPYPHVIANAKINETDLKLVVVGYTLAMLSSHEPLIPMAKGICARINAAEYRGISMRRRKYCIMGQVCIHKDFRGKGVFRGLYQQTKKRMSPHFDCIVTAISTQNSRSLHAHDNLGFETICEFRSSGQDWKIVLWDWNLT